MHYKLIDSLSEYFQSTCSSTPKLHIILSTYNTHQAQFGTQTMLGPLRLVTRDLGTQIAFVLAHGEPITFLA
jgi:hypothetical protein